MKSSHLSIILAGLLLIGIGLSIALVVIGPSRVERRAIAMFREQQTLVAEQGAMRIGETLRDVQTRIDEASDRLEEHGAPADTEELRSRLSDLSHPHDAKIGLALLVTSPTGDVLVVEPELEKQRAEKLAGLEFSPPENERTSTLRFCARCLTHSGSISVVSSLEGDRQLVANLDLDQWLEGVFQRITRRRHARAALLDAAGNVVFEKQNPPVADTSEVITGVAELPGSDWNVRIRTPVPAIAPQVRGTVRTVLYAALGMLVVFVFALGVLGFLAYRDYRDALERTEALARTEKLATVGMLGASIAHEIRNAVAAVKLNLELMRRSDESELEKYLDKAADTVDRLEELSENVTGYVRRSDGEPDIVELREPVEEAIDLIRPKLDVDLLHVDIDTNPRAEASGGALTQVVVNLLLNAYDAVAERDGEITVRVEQNGDSGRIEVLDDGPGIEPDVLDRLFEPFTSTKDEDAEGGTGLGLWLCAQIVEQYDGTIEAANRANGGARFTVEFPMVDDAEQALAEETAVDSRTGQFADAQRPRESTPNSQRREASDSET